MPFNPFSKKATSARGDAENQYARLRQMWLSGQVAAEAPSHLGPQDVIAVLVDFGTGGGTATAVAAEDGTASLYVDPGSGIIGMGFHATTAAAALALVGCAQSYVDVFPLAAHFALPTQGHVAFRIITRVGVRSAEFEETEMIRDRSLSPLHDAYQHLLTAMRILDESRRKGAMHPARLQLHIYFDGGVCLLTPGDPEPTWLTSDQLQRVLEIAKSQGDRLEVSAEPGEPRTVGSVMQIVDASGMGRNAAPPPANVGYLGGSQTLHYAVTSARVDLVADMIQRGADLEAKDDLGYTPLILAAFEGRRASLRALVKAGSKTQALDRKGNSPLMFAAQSGDIEAVRLLLDAGADVSNRSEQGHTALEIAKLCGHADITRLLIDAGAPD